jgi:Holliday junction resolvase RusA-like endonuclease
MIEAQRNLLAVPIDWPVAVDCHWVFPRPATHFGTGRFDQTLKASAPTWYALKKRNDRDNLDKAVLDVLTACGLLADDGLACDGRIQKTYAHVGQRPGCEIVIRDPGEPQ